MNCHELSSGWLFIHLQELNHANIYFCVGWCCNWAQCFPFWHAPWPEEVRQVKPYMRKCKTISFEVRFISLLTYTPKSTSSGSSRINNPNVKFKTCHSVSISFLKSLKLIFRHGFTVVFTAWRHADGPEGCGRKTIFLFLLKIFLTDDRFFFFFKTKAKLSNQTEQTWHD